LGGVLRLFLRREITIKARAFPLEAYSLGIFYATESAKPTNDFRALRKRTFVLRQQGNPKAEMGALTIELLVRPEPDL
jgi:hypothetical protein